MSCNYHNRDKIKSVQNEGIKTLPPLESPYSGLFNGTNTLILILHFDAQNGPMAHRG